MPTFLRGRTDVDYTGYDLLPVNIEAAKDRFKNESWVFDTWDLVKDKIGRGTSPECDIFGFNSETQFDIIICRHTSIHLGLHDNIQVCPHYHHLQIYLPLSDVSQLLPVPKQIPPRHNIPPPAEEHPTIPTGGQKVRKND